MPTKEEEHFNYISRGRITEDELLQLLNRIEGGAYHIAHGLAHITCLCEQGSVQKNIDTEKYELTLKGLRVRNLLQRHVTFDHIGESVAKRGYASFLKQESYAKEAKHLVSSLNFLNKNKDIYNYNSHDDAGGGNAYHIYYVIKGFMVLKRNKKYRKNSRHKKFVLSLSKTGKQLLQDIKHKRNRSYIKQILKERYNFIQEYDSFFYLTSSPHGNDEK